MDSFLLENAIWKVILSNSQEIISDNLYIDDKSDWVRLKEYIQDNNLSISSMYICFRNHSIKIDEAKHYFFRRMSLSRFGKIERKNETYSYFLVGSTNDKTKVNIKKYLVPELQCMEEEIRTLEENEESLI